MSLDRLDILFVDDERRILDGLRRQLHGRRDRWEMRFAESGPAALAALAERPADVVVTDMRMPGMTGGELLRHVADRWPGTVRIVLSGQTDQAGLITDLAPIHQYIQKPCSPEVLPAAIERTHRLAVKVGDPRTRLAATRAAVLLPSVDVFQSLTAELAAGAEADARRVAALVERDPALAAKLVQLVSSAFFGTPRAVRGATDAVHALGVQVIQSIVVAGRLFDAVGGPGDVPAVARVWAASAAIADAAEAFAARARAGPAARQEARLAGLMSLLGRAVLMTADPAGYADVLARTPALSLVDAERAVFGATQEDVTAYVLGLWAFPEPLVEAVACQCRPDGLTAAGPHPGLYLHLARATTPTADPLVAPPPLDVALVHARGLGSLIDTATATATDTVTGITTELDASPRRAA